MNPNVAGFMIQMIMKMTDGPTDGKSVIEYTDWAQVDRLAERMANAVIASGTVEPGLPCTRS